MLPRHRRRRRTLVAVCVALAIGAGWWTLVPAAQPPALQSPAAPPAAARGNDAVAPQGAGAAHSAGTGGAQAAPARSVEPHRGVAPLPPSDAALIDIAGVLEQRAAQGDRRAACRLALDAELCRNGTRYAAALEHSEIDIARQPHSTDGDIAHVERLQRRVDAAARVCRGLPEGWADARAWRYMLQAAQLGDMRLAARFAAAPPLDRARFLEQADRWQVYAQHAPQLLQQAAAHGDPRALYYLQRAYAGLPVIEGMPGAFARDPQRALALALLLHDISDPRSRADHARGIQALREELDAAAQDAAAREAAALRQRVRAERSAFDFAGGVFGEQDARICEQDAAA